MLKQQSAEGQTTPTIRVPLSPYAQTIGETAPALTTEEKQTVTRATRFVLPPLLLEGHHYMVVAAVPLLYAAMNVVRLEWKRSLVPYHTTDSQIFLDVASLLLPPVILCVLLGIYLRNKRVAAVSGTLIALAFHAAYIVLNLLDALSPRYSTIVTPLYHIPWGFRQVLIHMLVTALITVGAAGYAQWKFGGRTARDKDRDR